MSLEPSSDAVQRRVAPVPVVVAVVVLMAFAIVATIVVTLAVAGGPSVNAEQSAPSSTPSEREPDTATPESPIVAPAEESTGARCVDSTAEVEELDIDEVSVSQSDRDDVSVTFTLASTVPDGAAHLGISAHDAEGETRYQFILELDDGEIDRITVQDVDRDKSDKADVKDADIDGSVARFEVPRSVAKKLGEDWQWFAFTTLDGVALDACPGESGSRETLAFDSEARATENSDRDD